MGYYDVAQICLNGHLANDSTRESPQFNQKHCEKCGSKTITQCPQCNKDIRGYYHVDGILDLTSRTIEPPPFCIECGNPYPWTEEKIIAAKELASELEGLSEDEKVALQNSIDYLVCDNPRTQLEATKFKKIMLKVGSEGYGIFKDILIDILSSTAKKVIYGE